MRRQIVDSVVVNDVPLSPQAEVASVTQLSPRRDTHALRSTYEGKKWFAVRTFMY